MVDKILETIVGDHEEKVVGNIGQKRNDMDFVDVLLSLIKKSSNTHDELSRTAIEWIMTELMRHPRVMKKLQEEVNNVIGDNEIVEEMHLGKFTYLDMVTKESLRLHPVVPLLFFRESMEDIVVNGYFIPKKSRIFINFWVLGRDLKIWSENVEELFLEKFIGKNIDIRGHNFELTPFGSGQRGCPGMHLGLINIRQIVAQLVHCFDWELPKGMSVDDLDMEEKFGLTLLRVNHLCAVPTLRSNLKK